jgi:molecular chaperone HscB
MTTTCEFVCPHCGVKPSAPDFCHSCGKVLPSSTFDNYFSILGLEPKFHCREEELESAMFAKLSLFHPDNYSTSSPLEQEIAANRSFIVNQAYQALRKPIERLGHLLSLYNIATDDAAQKQALPPSFLMESMERHEELEEARVSQNKEKVISIQKELQDLKQKLLTQAATYIEKKEYSQAFTAYSQLRFVERLIQGWND